MDQGIPRQPLQFFTDVFAKNGERAVIPADQAAAGAGRASMELGFPPETQLPLNAGGVAPNRLDFQGILHMLSAFAFWQQSGGMFTYSSALNYAPPAVVFSNGSLWWCEKENGVRSANGLVQPGTNEEYWVQFLTKITQMLSSSGAGASTGLVPVGGVVLWSQQTAPDGFLPCSGIEFDSALYPKLFQILGTNRTPDMRGLFPRGFDPTGTRDPDGPTRVIRSIQNDTMLALSGAGTFEASTFPKGLSTWWNYTDGKLWSYNYVTGAFSIKKILEGKYAMEMDEFKTPIRMNVVYEMNLANAVPADKVSSEIRSKNMSWLYIIKHD